MVKKIILLIGPKGAGKSFIGEMIEKQSDFKFIRVEDWILKSGLSPEFHNDEYLRMVFDIILKGIRKELLSKDKIVFESTGLTEHFDSILADFRQQFQVSLIKIKADPMLCIERIKSRDSSIHLKFSDDDLVAINKQVESKEIKCDFVLDNNEIENNSLSSQIESFMNQIDEI